MQRDGHSDERTKAGASGRTPPVIEGEAVEVHAPQPAQFENAGAAEVVAAEKDLASESAADEMQATHPQDEAAADEAWRRVDEFVGRVRGASSRRDRIRASLDRRPLAARGDLQGV